MAAPHERDKHGKQIDDPSRLRDMQTCQARRMLAYPYSLPLTPYYSLPNTYYLLLTHYLLTTDLLEYRGDRDRGSVHVQPDQH